MLLIPVSRSHQQVLNLESRHESEAPVPLMLDLMLSGPARGFSSDLDILKVFSIFYQADQHPESGASLWPSLAAYLERSQRKDPYFIDTYRLACSLLAYDANMPEKAVQLVREGLPFLESWDIPFLAGFIAHDKLHDDRLAFALMKSAAEMKNAPPLTLNLAFRFLSKAEGPEAAIAFLTKMARTLPKQYRKGIIKRILQLKENRNESSD